MKHKTIIKQKGGSMSKQIATTILRQLGGNVFISMVGAKDFVYDTNCLQFGFKGSRKANKCKIILNANDTYTVQFYKLKMKTFECPMVYEVKEIYNDSLTGIFTQFTLLECYL